MCSHFGTSKQSKTSCKDNNDSWWWNETLMRASTGQSMWTYFLKDVNWKKKLPMRYADEKVHHLLTSAKIPFLLVTSEAIAEVRGNYSLRTLVLLVTLDWDSYWRNPRIRFNHRIKTAAFTQSNVNSALLINRAKKPCSWSLQLRSIMERKLVHDQTTNGLRKVRGLELDEYM